ncbi:MAG: MFS transporter [Rhodospirillales bacterium]|nr:MFS transporter [Rhodospirillales bacterium]MDP6773014.1 MFS transporter [Rhodospirillales bacterium]
MTNPNAEAASKARQGGVRAFVVVVLPFSCGYYVSYLYRSVNAVIAPQLVAEFGLDAADLGFLTAAYFFSFGVVQLPLGVVLDRYGPRTVLAVLLAIAAAGSVLFGVGNSMFALVAGRSLIGLGVSATMMGSFKAITLWFPQGRWPVINGVFMAMGGAGAMSATTPIEALLAFTDWRGIFLAMAAVTAGVAVLILLVVPERRDEAEADQQVGQIEGLKVIYRDRFFWRVAPLTFICQATQLAILGLWSGPWLRDVAGLDRGGVATSLFIIAAGLTLGFAGLGLLANLAERCGMALIRFTGTGILVMMAALAAIVFEAAPGSVWPWFIFGFMSNVAVLNLPVLSRYFPLSYSGRVFTSVNLFVILGAFAVQSGIGAIIDLWPVTAHGGYDREAYRVAFGAMLGLEALAFLWFLVPHERRAGRRA